MIKFILIFTLISNFAFAQDAQLVTKGQIVPFTGDLLTLDQTKSLYNDSLEKTSLQKQLDLENQNVTLLTQEKTLLQTQNQKLVEAANSEAHMNEWTKIGYFALGIIVTGLAVKGAASIRP